MPVTATGFYSTLFLPLSDSLFLSLSFLFPPAVKIFISDDSPIARARYRSFLDSRATYAMVVELSCFYLVPCRRAIFLLALPTHLPRISPSYFRLSLFYPQRYLYTDGFSVRAVHYRLVRVSFASFIFFPRLLFPVSPSFLLPSTSNLSHSVLSLSSSTVLFPSSFLFLFLVFLSTVLPSLSYIYTQRGRMF